MPVTRDRTTQSMFGKVTYSPVSRLQLNFSSLWTPDKADGTHRRLRRSRCRITTTSDRAGSALATRQLGYEIPQWNMAYTGDYTATDRTLISVRGGYMHDNYFDTGVNKSQTFEYATATASLPPALLATVPAQFSQPANYSNLPRIQIKDHDLTTRNFADFSITQIVNAAGQHQFKGGFGMSRRHKRCPACVSEQWLCHASSGTRRYTSDVPGVGAGTGRLRLLHDRRHRHHRKDWCATSCSLFVQDNWTVGSRLTLNLGLRMESEDIPSFRPDIQEVGIHFGWGEKLAPRLGFAYNLFGDDRVKISGFVRALLRLDEVRAGAWHVRWRRLDDSVIARSTIPISPS